MCHGTRTSTRPPIDRRVRPLSLRPSSRHEEEDKHEALSLRISSILHFHRSKRDEDKHEALSLLWFGGAEVERGGIDAVPLAGGLAGAVIEEMA